MKGIFLDYTGTITQEGGPDVAALLERLCAGSSCKDMKWLLHEWWRLVKLYENQSYKEDYLTEDEIVDLILHKWEDEIDLKENLKELHDLCRRYWMYAPVYSDAIEFFERCPLPIYVVTNNGSQYVEVCMERNGLHPAGIICGDMVRAYKPHRELFEEALRVSGYAPNEVVHIGDSVASDVEGARTAGIRPIFLNRSEGEVLDGIESVGSLLEALERVL